MPGCECIQNIGDGVKIPRRHGQLDPGNGLKDLEQISEMVVNDIGNWGL